MHGMAVCMGQKTESQTRTAKFRYSSYVVQYILQRGFLSNCSQNILAIPGPVRVNHCHHLLCHLNRTSGEWKHIACNNLVGIVHGINKIWEQCFDGFHLQRMNSHHGLAIFQQHLVIFGLLKGCSRQTWQKGMLGEHGPKTAELWQRCWNAHVSKNFRSFCCPLLIHQLRNTNGATRIQTLVKALCSFMQGLNPRCHITLKLASRCQHPIQSFLQIARSLEDLRLIAFASMRLVCLQCFGHRKKQMVLGFIFTKNAPTHTAWRKWSH